MNREQYFEKAKTFRKGAIVYSSDEMGIDLIYGAQEERSINGAKKHNKGGIVLRKGEVIPNRVPPPAEVAEPVADVAPETSGAGTQAEQA